MMVPSPIPFNLWKKRKDRSVAMTIRVTSNRILTLPNSMPDTLAMAWTMPSPGTLMTSGATSTLMPTARIAQPTSRLKVRSGMVCGFRPVILKYFFPEVRVR